MNKHVKTGKRRYYNLELTGMQEVIHVNKECQSIAVNKATRLYAGQRKFCVVCGMGRDIAVGITTP